MEQMEVTREEFYDIFGTDSEDEGSQEEEDSDIDVEDISGESEEEAEKEEEPAREEKSAREEESVNRAANGEWSDNLKDITVNDFTEPFGKTFDMPADYTEKTYSRSFSTKISWL